MYKDVLLRASWLLGALAMVIVIVWTLGSGGSNAADAEIRQTFLQQFVVAGGPIVWFVLIPMSVVMVYLVVEYSLTIRRKKLFPSGAGDQIVQTIRNSGVGRLQATADDNTDMVSKAVTRAVVHGRGDRFRVRNLVFESLEEQALVLVRRIEWLNLIGSVSPMVGLFGTVFGMIRVFNGIVATGGQSQPAQLAGGISVALVTTFWGLVIAIPALGIHGIFRNRIEILLSESTAEAEDVLPEIIACLAERQTSEKKTEVSSRQKLRIEQVASRRLSKQSEPHQAL
jgi:biopolymer transport protein ExbB